MIRAVFSRGDGKRKLLLIGLSEENVRRLRDGKPVLLEGEEIGLDVDVCVCHGETEQALMGELRAIGLLPIPE